MNNPFKPKQPSSADMQALVRQSEETQKNTNDSLSNALSALTKRLESLEKESKNGKNAEKTTTSSQPSVVKELQKSTSEQKLEIDRIRQQLNSFIQEERVRSRTVSGVTFQAVKSIIIPGF